MKVAYLTTNLSSDNGWGRYSLEIIKRMPRHNIEPVVFMMPPAPQAVPAPIAVHARLRSFSDGRLKPLRMFLDWAEARRDARQCAIIHCLAEPFMPLATMLASAQQSLIVNAVGTYAVFALKTRWQRLYRKAYARADAVLAISRYTAQQAEKNLPQVADKLRVIPLGVDADSFPGPFPPARERAPAFLMVGQVKARKGTLQAVEAMARVVRRFPEAKLYIAGSTAYDAYVQTVRHRVTASGIEGNVIWLGRISEAELLHYYRQVRGLVMPSMNAGDSFEGFGLVHLEANACGVPAIGSLGCGNEDAIRDGYSGFLIEQGNIPALSEAMLRLLDPHFDWDGMSANALQFARSMSWDYVADSCVSVYNEMVQHKNI